MQSMYATEREVQSWENASGKMRRANKNVATAPQHETPAIVY